ncbi:MAG: serine/threonine protein kinase, partial [Myxococcales bacterium]|nr:serine/threonine protein kinase [Myxococcales bacterium]
MSTQTATQTVRDYFIGAQVGGYRITAKLGEGAMGVVYRGEHTVLGRPAAIKFLNADLVQNEDLVSRFFTEARAVNGIRHPNIVDITDFGQRGTRHYYVMEYLDGQTLLDRLTLEGRTDLESTIRIGMQVAAALAAAHDKGIVHRDLKPENIYLCNHPDYPDYVKVFDFGIAKLIEKTPTDTHRTGAGYVLGTPLYMSPEQCVGEESLDHRSDIYSLGIVLYQMIAGVVPFNAPTLAGIVQGHMSRSPARPTDHNSSVPPQLEELILGALAKDPEERIPDMRTMRAMLEACDPNSAPVEFAPISPDASSGGGRYGTQANTASPTDGGNSSEKLVDELIAIILERIESDRLVLPAMPASALAAIRELE